MTKHHNQCRIFLGVPIAKSIFEYLKQSLLTSETDLSNGRWVMPENAHLTIRFIGDVERVQLAALWESIQKALKKTASFPLSLIEIGCFPIKEAPLIAAVGENNDLMEDLFSLVDRVVQSQGFLAKQTPFRPHVTLFHYQRSPPPLLLTPIKLSHCDIAIDQIVLYETKSTTDGSVYEPLYQMFF